MDLGTEQGRRDDRLLVLAEASQARQALEPALAGGEDVADYDTGQARVMEESNQGSQAEPAREQAHRDEDCANPGADNSQDSQISLTDLTGGRDREAEGNTAQIREVADVGGEDGDQASGREPENSREDHRSIERAAQEVARSSGDGAHASAREPENGHADQQSNESGARQEASINGDGEHESGREEEGWDMEASEHADDDDWADSPSPQAHSLTGLSEALAEGEDEDIDMEMVQAFGEGMVSAESGDVDGWTEEFEEEGDEDSQADSTEDEDAEVTYDPAIAARHEYLGDCDDLAGGYVELEEGEEYRLSVLPLDGVVLMPGATLPLKLCRLGEVQLLDMALRRPPPTNRLLVVVDIRVRVLPSGDVTPLPRPIKEGHAYIPLWAARPFDPTYLVARAQKLCANVLPHAGRYEGTPQAYSFYLAANLPIGGMTSTCGIVVADARDTFLMTEEGIGAAFVNAHGTCSIVVADARDTFLMTGEGIGAVFVNAHGTCSIVVADARDTFLMTEEGIGAAFVNAHGIVHDMATFRKIRGVSYYGRPETEHSWFPGYAWTICNCRNCYEHLGWCFSAVLLDLSPANFSGIRQAALASPLGWSFSAVFSDLSPAHFWGIRQAAFASPGWRFSAVLPDLSPSHFWGIRRAAFAIPSDAEDDEDEDTGSALPGLARPEMATRDRKRCPCAPLLFYTLGQARSEVETRDRTRIGG
eukprot:gene7467-608_t